jgi:cell division ATPase FtsA
MGIFSKQEEERELVLVFDIGSSSIGGAVFEIQKSGTPKIIKTFREPIILEDKIDTERFLLLTIKALEIVASKICMMGVGKMVKIFCVLSSPWYASQTRTIKLEKNTSFLFTSKLADDLIQKEIKLFEEEHLVKFLNTDNKIRPIEFKNMKTMLNGYTTADPFDKKAKKLEMVVFISMSGDQVLKKMEETISRHFHSKEIKFSSFAMASFVVARDMFVQQDNFLLVDIAGEVTDISMIKKDILSDSISYPLGYNFIIREVANNLNCTLNEAKALISLYKDEHAEKATEEKLEPIISKLKTEWLKGFQQALVNLSEDISIPATIFITVDKELADFFSKIIKTEQFNQYTLTESEFQIIFLGAETLHHIVSFKNDLNRDPFLAIESIYINRFIC